MALIPPEPSGESAGGKSADERPRNRLQDVFDGWAIQCLDEEHAVGAETSHKFIERIPELVREGRRRSDVPGPEGNEKGPKDFEFSALELGCGSGEALRRIGSLEGCVRAEGVDISPRMLWKGRYYFEDQTPATVRYHRACDLLQFSPRHSIGPDELRVEETESPTAENGAAGNMPWMRCDVVYSFATLYYICPLERLSAEKIREWVLPGGAFIAGTDFFLENEAHCGHWANMLNLDMDLRSKEDWKTVFSKVLQLEGVQQISMEYSQSTEPDMGSLFTYGFVPRI
jgi:SAM-dependent methyltransferase